MQKIYRINSGDVQKMEFVSLFNEVVSIAESYEPNKLHAGLTFGLLKGGLSLAGELCEPEIKSLLTPQLQTLKTKRAEIVSAMRMRINSYLISGDVTNEAATRQLDAIFKRNMKDFHHISSSNQSARVNFFLSEVKGDSSLTSVIVAIGLTALLERLRVAQLDIEAMQNARRLETSKRPRVDSKLLKQQMYALMCNFFNAIEAAQLEHPDLQYSNLVNELKQAIGAVKTRVASKRSRTSNRKLLAKSATLNAS